MVDCTKALGNWLNVDMVKSSNVRKMVIIGEGLYKELTYGNTSEYKEALVLPVEYDKNVLEWKPNQMSVRNLSRVWGKDTKAWVGKVVTLRVTTIRGKESIEAYSEANNEHFY